MCLKSASIVAAVVLLGIADAVSADEPGRITYVSCPGRGYLPYSYPAFGSCPCGDSDCFHPGRYFAECGEGDGAYKRAFWKRWWRAHYCGDSMLDGMPCDCSTPTSSSLLGARTSAMPAPLLPPAPSSSPAQETLTTRANPSNVFPHDDVE